MSLRGQVLAAFRNVHRAGRQVFVGDANALVAARVKINSEFRNNQALEDEDKIKELVQTANEAAIYLRSNVVQAKLNEEKNSYQVKITKDTVVEENTPFLGGDEAPPRPRRRKNPPKGCSG